MFVLSVYINLVGQEEIERRKKKHRQYIFLAGIHQSKREGKRRENNMTNEKIDMNKIYTENIHEG
jgi:hypothetical protein